MKRIFEKLSKAFRHAGVGGALRYVASGLLRIPERLRRRLFRSRFDREFGTNTDAIVYHDDLDIPDSVREHVTYYAATPVATFREMLEKANIHYPDYTFVDIGAGRGRLLMLAAGYPFAGVVGIEISTALWRDALVNIEKIPPTKKIARNVECLCLDVRAFEYPDGPLLIYLYQPFDDAILIEALDRIRTQFERRPHDITIIYAGSAPPLPIRQASWLSRIADGKFISEGEGRRPSFFEIYRCRATENAGRRSGAG